MRCKSVTRSFLHIIFYGNAQPIHVCFCTVQKPRNAHELGKRVYHWLALLSVFETWARAMTRCQVEVTNAITRHSQTQQTRVLVCGEGRSTLTDPLGRLPINQESSQNNWRLPEKRIENLFLASEICIKSWMCVDFVANGIYRIPTSSFRHHHDYRELLHSEDPIAFMKLVGYDFARCIR